MLFDDNLPTDCKKQMLLTINLFRFVIIPLIKFLVEKRVLIRHDIEFLRIIVYSRDYVLEELQFDILLDKDKESSKGSVICRRCNLAQSIFYFFFLFLFASSRTLKLCFPVPFRNITFSSIL